MFLLKKEVQQGGRGTVQHRPLGFLVVLRCAMGWSVTISENQITQVTNVGRIKGNDTIKQR